MRLKAIVQRILYREKYSSDTYIPYLRKKGISIGEDCTIYVPRKTTIDLQYPWMITIGNHVRITEGVRILTHDFAWSVLKRYTSETVAEGNILGASGKVIIGDNVFIGMDTIILRNVKIGNNVIIGAGSVVTSDCLSDSVYAGNPAKRVMSIEDYFQKRKEKQLQEACELARQYYKKYMKRPSEDVFSEYFMLFSSKTPENEAYIEQMKLCQNYDETLRVINNNQPLFTCFDEFLNYCFEG